MAQNGSVVVAAGDGEQLWFGGGTVSLKVTGERSEGRSLIFTDRMPKGKTTPLHVHPSFDETIYVIDGALLVHVDGEEFEATAGALAFIARGSAHAFLVTSEEANVISVSTPGDVAERFFREGGDPVTDGETPALDIAKITSAGERTGGMQVLGPPPFSR